MKLINKKWSNFNEFLPILDYLNKNFFNKNNTWYEGYSDFTPSTNNCLEAFNNIIKRDYVFYNRKHFLELINIFIDIINIYSNKYNIINNGVSEKKFAINLIYTNEKILDLNFKTIFENDIYKYYCIDNNLINDYLKIEEILKSNFQNIKKLSEFDLFLKTILIYYNKNYPINQYNLFCTCYDFLKKYKCSHLISWAKFKNLDIFIKIINNNKKKEDQKILEKIMG